MRPASATIPAFMPDLTDPDVQQVLADLTASLALAETRAQKIRQAHGAGQTGVLQAPFPKRPPRGPPRLDEVAGYPDVSRTSCSSGVLTSPMAAQPAPVLPAASLAAPLFKGPPPGLQCWGTATWTQLLPQLPPPLTLAPGAKVKAAPPDGSPLWVRPPLPLQQQNPEAAFTSETNYAKDVGPPLDVGLPLQQQDPEAAFTSDQLCRVRLTATAAAEPRSCFYVTDQLRQRRWTATASAEPRGRFYVTDKPCQGRWTATAAAEPRGCF